MGPKPSNKHFSRNTINKKKKSLAYSYELPIHKHKHHSAKPTLHWLALPHYIVIAVEAMHFIYCIGSSNITSEILWKGTLEVAQYNK